MKTIIRGGILLGILVTIWMFIFGAMGLHRTLTGPLVWACVATLIELAVLVWGLRRTAAEGRRWFGQVSAGTMLAFVGGCVIFAASYFYVTSMNPGYIGEAMESTAAALRASGKDEATVQAQMAEMAKMATPVWQALTGFIATVVMGFILSAILGLFIRAKGTAAPAAVPA
jgi:uncharacterized protein DUF4199